MKNRRNLTIKSLVFSKWTRKGYAAFASLGKLVTIAHRSFAICKSFLSNKNNILPSLTNAPESTENQNDNNDTVFTAWLETMLMELGIVSLDEAYYSTNQNIIIGRSPYFTNRRIWTFSFYTKP